MPINPITLNEAYYSWMGSSWPQKFVPRRHDSGPRRTYYGPVYTGTTLNGEWVWTLYNSSHSVEGLWLEDWHKTLDAAIYERSWREERRNGELHEQLCASDAVLDRIRLVTNSAGPGCVDRADSVNARRLTIPTHTGAGHAATAPSPETDS